MEIKASWIRPYLDMVTIEWFNDHDIPPYTVEEYYDRVMQMKLRAEHAGETDRLKLAFEHILGNPDFDLNPLASVRFDYDDEDIREIIEFAWQTIWPDAKPIPQGGPPDVAVVPW